jgi:HEAT repeat protein
MMTREIYRPPEYRDDAIQRAIGKLKSFHDGDIAVLEVVACGDRAIPALRTLLFDREPSGLYQVRVRAVDALAKLGAHEVLVEFLSTPRDVTDPVERLGEDAVINAAARALADHSDERVFELLLRLAHRPCLTGVISALGTSRRPEAIPLLVDALSEDASRLTAEAALKGMGAASRPALIEAVSRRTDTHEHLSESRLRQRRSALRLLAETGVSRRTWQAVQHLMHDEDTRIAVLACEICLATGSTSEKRDSVLRLFRLFPNADWTLRDEIERYLVTHLHIAKETIAGSTQLSALMAEDSAVKELAERILYRVQEYR